MDGFHIFCMRRVSNYSYDPNVSQFMINKIICFQANILFY